MSMRFPYQSFPVGRPLVTLAGRSSRPRPILSVNVIGPAGRRALDALVDTGSDDTVFPGSLAARIGLDLTAAPIGSASGVGQVAGMLRHAQVRLRIADHQEQREWEAWVAFTAAKLRQPLLGFAGFLQYFTAVFDGEREELELTVNGRYPGT
jgi:predicted aspartyl protease